MLTKSDTFRAQLLAVVVTTVLVFGAVAALRWSGLLQWLELQAYDLFVRVKVMDPPSEQKIVIVSIDEEDVTGLGWPLTDGTLADLLVRLTRLHPAIIGVDVYRDQPVGDGHEQLDRVLHAHENIIWVTKFAEGPWSGVRPPPALVGTDRVGFSDVVPDANGTVRRGVLFLDDGVTVEFSFSLRLALRQLAAQGILPRAAEHDPNQIQLGSIVIAPFESNDGSYVGADASGYQYLLDYRHGPPSFPVLKLSELLAGQVSPDSVRGKIVLVGVTAESVKDYFYTPFSQGSDLAHATYGVQLQGEMVAQLLRHALDATPPTKSFAERYEALWIFFWTILGAGLVWGLRSPLLFVLALGAILISLTAICYVAMLFAWWVPMVPAAMGAVASATLGASYVSYKERRERANLMFLFSRHVSSRVAEEIWRRRDEFLEKGRPKPQILHATVVFADIRNFTEISEDLEPSDLIDWLNGYMSAMAALVSARGGIVDKYIGDAVMAVFGVPVPSREGEMLAEQARNAARCALGMRREMERLNQEWETAGLPRTGVRIGIHTGEVVAGSLGSAERLEYTVIGDTVNTASRLESYASEILEFEDDREACPILISDTTRQLLDRTFTVREIGRASLKGKAKPVVVFQLIDEAEAFADDAKKEQEP